MTSDDTVMPERSYGCTFGCGNPYDFIVVNVADSDTQFLCVPCFVKVAGDFVEAMMNPENEHVQAAVALRNQIAAGHVPGPSGKRGRRNAPSGIHDVDVLSAFDPYTDIDEAEDS